MIIFLSLKLFYSLFLYGLNDWIFESCPIRNRGEGVKMGKSTYTMGDLSNVCVRLGRGGQMLATLVRMY